MTEKVLKHFTVDGKYGGSQAWMTDPWMRLGGCGALAALDSCFFFAKNYHINKTVGDTSHISKGRYLTLAQEMKPYLRPRFHGIDRMEIYRLGFQDYLNDHHVTQIKMTEYPMGGQADAAWEVYKTQIDRNLIVPVLLLNPAHPEWKDYRWHWFLLNGYREEGGDRWVNAVTYGGSQWMHFDTFWDTEHNDNGGMILYDLEA